MTVISRTALQVLDTIPGAGGMLDRMLIQFSEKTVLCSPFLSEEWCAVNQDRSLCRCTYQQVLKSH